MLEHRGLPLNIFAKFIFAGVCNLFFGYLVFSSHLYFFSDGIWVANFFAVVAVSISGYCLSQFAVFQSKRKGNFFLYVALIIAQYFVFTPFIAFLDSFWFSPQVSYLIACVPAVVVSFSVQKFIIFKSDTL